MAAAEEVRKPSSGFSVLAGGEESTAGVLLLSTGVRYELPRSKAQRNSGPEASFTARTAMPGRYGIDPLRPTEPTPPDSRCC